MLTAHNPETIAAPVAYYSHGIEVPAGARTLHIAGSLASPRKRPLKSGLKLSTGGSG